MCVFRKFALFIIPLSFLVTNGQAETRILFCGRTNDTEDYELYSMNTNGADLAQITTNTTSEWGPAIGPDANSVAVINPADGSISIVTINNGNSTAVNNTNVATSVQWADTNTLFYLTVVDWDFLTFELWQIDIDGNNEQKAYTNLFSDWPMGFDYLHVDRAQGRVYINTWPLTQGGSVICSGPIDGTGVDLVHPVQAPLHDYYSDHYAPAVSPDGVLIAYCADYGMGEHQLYVGTNASASAATMLCDTYSSNPAWSPDGTWVAFVRATESTWGGQAYVGNITTRRIDLSGTIDNLTGAQSVANRCAYPTVYNVPVDIDHDGMNDQWETSYFGGTDVINGNWDDDWDNDGVLNLHEFIAGTTPTNSIDKLSLNITFTNSKIVVNYNTLSATGAVYIGKTRLYDLETSSNIISDNWSLVPDETNIAGANTTRRFTNGTPVNAQFYRVKARLEQEGVTSRLR